MKLGYSYRLSQYAFFLGLLGLVLAGSVVFFLNLLALRTESFQMQLTTSLTRAAITEPTTEPEVEMEVPQSRSSPEYAPPPAHKKLARQAALQTVRMLRPMAFYLALTGGSWLLLRGATRRPAG